MDALIARPLPLRPSGYDAVVVLIGLVLVAIAAGFTADVFVQNADPVQVDVLGRNFSGRPGWLVVAGALVLIIFYMGARLLVLGVSRARRRRVLLREFELVSAASARITSPPNEPQPAPTPTEEAHDEPPVSSAEPAHPFRPQ